MNRSFHLRFFVGLIFSMLLASCEEPQLRADRVVEKADVPVLPAPVTPVAGEVPTVPAPVDGPLTVAPVAEEPELPTADAEFSITMEGDRIIISGALRSRIQQERIVAAMTGGFPEYKIVSDLKVEHHRTPVGWGNRLGDECLVPYFHLVKAPRVAYSEGIVTLEGVVKNVSQQRQLTELVIETFAGEGTRDIDNKITTEK